MKDEDLNAYQSKDVANVKVFADTQTDKWADKRTGQKLFAPDLSMRGHKKYQRRLTLVEIICY